MAQPWNYQRKVLLPYLGTVSVGKTNALEPVSPPQGTHKRLTAGESTGKNLKGKTAVAYDPLLQEYFAKVQAGQAVEAWEEPFVCDGCGGYFHGGEMAACSNGERIVCRACSEQQ